VAPIARSDDGQVAVAVDDLTTGADAAYAGTREFVTASIVKVDIRAHGPVPGLHPGPDEPGRGGSAVGVPAAADDGTQFMVKNGWLPSGTTGRWEINSIGEVVHDRQRMLIAVLSEGNATEDSGISVVQTVAETAAGAVASAKA
jgi:hypothetical protein